MLRIIIITAIAFMSWTSLQAAPAGSISTNQPPQKTWGTYVGVGNPYPTLLGLNAAYNLNQNVRAVIGYGELEVTTSLSFSSEGVSSESAKAQTYALGADYLFSDGGLRPVIGARVGYFNLSGSGKIDVQGIDSSQALLYSNVGLDWIADGGFHAGTGVNVAMLGGSGTNFYANFGYFY